MSHIFFVGVQPPIARRNLARRDGRPLAASGSPGLPPASPPADSHSDFDALDPFLVWLLAQADLDAHQYRATALQRRLPACLRLLRATSPQQARRLLEQTPNLLPQAMDSVLIGVSEFFRDRAAFAVLQEQVLPVLLKTRAGLRVFSAGCSQGQELYSLALLLAEAGALARSDLLGVDCRPQAIAAARAGWFDVKELLPLPPAWRQKYFLLQEGRAQVSPGLRAKTRWLVADLNAPAEASLWDLVLFRNVAIYLETNHASSLWEKLVRSLSPGSVLVTGQAERPPTGLPLRRLASCVYQKTEDKSKL